MTRFDNSGELQGKVSSKPSTSSEMVQTGGLTVKNGIFCYFVNKVGNHSLFLPPTERLGEGGFWGRS